MRKLIRIIAVILLIVGIGFFAYPIALRVVFNMQANQAIDQFEQLKTMNYKRIILIITVIFRMLNCARQCLIIMRSYI